MKSVTVGRGELASLRGDPALSGTRKRRRPTDRVFCDLPLRMLTNPAA
jgi:hypothetical protein